MKLRKEPGEPDGTPNATEGAGAEAPVRTGGGESPAANWASSSCRPN